MPQVAWYCQVVDRVLGPLTSYQLMEMAKSGRLCETDMVKNDDTDWMEARMVAGLEFGSRGLVASTPTNCQTVQVVEPDNTGLSISSFALAGFIVAAIGGMGIIGLLLAFAIMAQSSSGDSGDYVAVQTKAAWDQMQQIDIQLRPVMNNAPTLFWEQHYVQYASINTDYVDEELATLIREWGNVSAELDACMKAFIADAERLGREAEATAALGAMLGASSSRDPQAGAMAGAVILGTMAEATRQQQLDQLGARHSQKYDPLMLRASQIRMRREQMAVTLTNRYGIPFRQRL